MNFLEHFKHFILKEDLFHPKDKLLLAVSGGVDSVVLCELCKQAGYDFSIAHCNFQLRGAESNRDEQFVKELAAKYDVDFFTKTFDTHTIAKERKAGIEEAARDLRYEWFLELIAADQPTTNDQGPTHIVTAHHADDNIETVLMNFFRGTGLKGMRGILPKRGRLVRPLLFAYRKEIEAFAAQQQLAFVTDSTNAENTYTRNFFRNELLPAIEKVFPETKENMLNNIRRNRGVAVLYKQALEIHAKKLLLKKGNEIHIPVLKLAQTKPLLTVTYELTKAYGFSPHQLEDIINLLSSESGKYVQSPTHRIIRNRKWLIIAPNQTAEAQHILIEAQDKTIVFENGTLEISHTSTTEDAKPKTESSIAQLDASDIKFPLLLRKWKQGDYFYPLGMQKKKKLSRFFVDQKLSLTDKEKVWVIESNKKILWVIGMRIDDRFKLTGKTTTMLQLTFKKKDA
jgi:tRNA(Ile)-lysidine synthase